MMLKTRKCYICIYLAQYKPSLEETYCNQKSKFRNGCTFWIIYLSPLLWISLWRSSVLKRTKACLFCKLLRILVPCHKYFVESLCYDKRCTRHRRQKGTGAQICPWRAPCAEVGTKEHLDATWISEACSESTKEGRLTLNLTATPARILKND